MSSDLISNIRKKNTRQIHNVSQASNRDKKVKVKMILALIIEIQIQDSCSSDEELNTLPLIKNGNVMHFTTNTT
jgi:hypothetical protein